MRSSPRCTCCDKAASYRPALDTCSILKPLVMSRSRDHREANTQMSSRGYILHGPARRLTSARDYLQRDKLDVENTLKTIDFFAGGLS